jgi:hypothetical protein
LYAKTLTFKEAVDHLNDKMDNKTGDLANLMTEILQALQKKMGNEVEFGKFVKDDDVDILSVLTEGKDLDEKDLDKLLTSKDLLAIKPLPDLSKEVSSALSAGKSPAKVLEEINAKVGDKLSVSDLTGVVVDAAMAKVFEGKEADPKALEPFKPLLNRILVAPTDLAMQITAVFHVQLAWFAAGATKGLLKTLFITIFDMEVVSAEAFMGWKEDTRLHKKSKMKALLQVNGWLEEIKPKEEFEDEDEGDELEEEDEYLVNPNMVP